MTTFIYALCCPITDNIRYIGKSDNPKIRLIAHISRCKCENSHKNSWIISLLNNGLKPYLIIIDKVSINEWVFWEKHYISLYRSWGFKLVNMSLGGENPPLNKGKRVNPISEATRLKMSKSQKGNKNSFGRIISEETRLKISKANKGKTNTLGYKHTQESKDKIRISNSGKPSPNKGISHSEQTKILMSKKRSGIKLSDETKKRMSESKKGIPLSESTIIKMKEASKNRKRDSKTGFFIKNI